MSIPIPDIIYDNAPWIVGGVMVFLVIVAVFWLSIDLGNSREACADIGMLYNQEAHGCVEGVNVP